MKTIKLQDINILDIGNTIQVSGAIWSGKGKHYLCFIPGEYDVTDTNDFELLEMDLNDWEKFIKQTDLLETEILAKDSSGGLVKILVRKTTRQIDSKLQWKVFQRDKYTCRYCGSTGVPLTVDHLILWECGGPTIEKNLVSACKKCNKTRGNTEYKEWLQDPYYLRVSAKLSETDKEKNIELVSTLDTIQKMVHIKSR
jgi:hypothetical protein